MNRSNTLDNEAHQRSLKDFLTLYNTITEFCFKKCISNFNERSASGNETLCIDACTENYVQFNQRFMFNFVEHQERRKREQEAEAIEAARKLEAQQLQDAVTAATTGHQGEVTNVSPEQLDQAAQMLESMSGASSAGAGVGRGSSGLTAEQQAGLQVALVTQQQAQLSQVDASSSQVSSVAAQTAS